MNFLQNTSRSELGCLFDNMDCIGVHIIQPISRTVEHVIIVTVAIILQSALRIISAKQTKPAKIGGLKTDSLYTTFVSSHIASFLV